MRATAAARKCTAGAAAATLAAVLVLLPALPTLALRLARLPLPPLPVDLADLRREIRRDAAAPDGDVAGTDTLARADAADRHLSALVCAAAVVATAAGVLLVVAGGTAARWLAACAAAALLLRGRVHASRAQRVALLVSGAVVASALATVLARAATPEGRLVWAYGGALLTGAVVLAAALVLPERRHSPYWGRFADVVEIVALVAVLPLALAVLGVYAWARGLGG